MRLHKYTCQWCPVTATGVTGEGLVPAAPVSQQDIFSKQLRVMLSVSVRVYGVGWGPASDAVKQGFPVACFCFCQKQKECSGCHTK